MGLLQGNTYLLPIRIEDCDGKVVRADEVERGEFVVGGITKFYGEGGEVVWSDVQQAFVVPLSEKETFGLDKAVECQGRVLLNDGSVSGSVPVTELVYRSIGSTILSDGEGAGEESGKMLVLKLLKEFSTGGSEGGTTDYNELSNKPRINGVELVGDKTSEELGLGGGSGGGVDVEVDPTVPAHVKNIKESDINTWNNKADKDDIPDVSGLATTEYVNQKVSDLVGSAPEALDTLNELAGAVKENKNILDAIKVPTKTSELENDSGFITAADVPQTDLGNYYTKAETEAYVQSQIGASITEVLDTEV